MEVVRRRRRRRRPVSGLCRAKRLQHSRLTAFELGPHVAPTLATPILKRVSGTQTV